MLSAAAFAVSGTGTTIVSASIVTVSRLASSSPSRFRVRYTLRSSSVLHTFAK